MESIGEVLRARLDGAAAWPVGDEKILGDTDREEPPLRLGDLADLLLPLPSECERDGDEACDRSLRCVLDFFEPCTKRPIPAQARQTYTGTRQLASGAWKVQYSLFSIVFSCNFLPFRFQTYSTQTCPFGYDIPQKPSAGVRFSPYTQVGLTSTSASASTSPKRDHMRSYRAAHPTASDTMVPV